MRESRADDGKREVSGRTTVIVIVIVIVSLIPSLGDVDNKMITRIALAWVPSWQIMEELLA